MRVRGTAEAAQEQTSEVFFGGLRMWQLDDRLPKSLVASEGMACCAGHAPRD